LAKLEEAFQPRAATYRNTNPSTSTNMASPPPTNDTVLFRPRKKRKVYRQRLGDDEDGTIIEETSPPAQSLDELIAQAEAEADDVSMAEILRSRKLKKPREGMAFKAGGSIIRDDEGQLVLHEGPKTDVGSTRKFASEAGLIGDVSNKHM